MLTVYTNGDMVYVITALQCSTLAMVCCLYVMFTIPDNLKGEYLQPYMVHVQL